MMSHLIERMARAAHAHAQTCFPLLESWEKLPAERRAHQRQMMAHALAALTEADLRDLAGVSPDLAILPARPSEWVLAELQEAALNDDGSRADARRRYRSLIATATAPSAETSQGGA